LPPQVELLPFLQTSEKEKRKNEGDFESDKRKMKNFYAKNEFLLADKKLQNSFVGSGVQN